MIGKTSKYFYLMVLVLVVAFLITGCDLKRVERGYARDFIFSVEPTVSGSYSVFLTHDESVVYCTQDREMGQHLIDILENHDGEVIIEYATKEWGKDSEGELFGWDECQDYVNFTEVLLLSVKPVSSR